MNEIDPGTIDLYHCSQHLLEFGKIEKMLHVGTREQALARRAGGFLQRVRIYPKSIMIRMIDKGSWNKQALQTAFRKAQVAVYLNRHEAIALEELEASAKYDSASDAVFRRHVPSAQDSWIILDPVVIRSIEKVD